MTTETTVVDMGARYSVAGYGGIAFYLIGYATEWTEETWEYLGDENDPDAGAEDYYDRTGYYYPDENPANYLYNEPEEIENRQMVRAVMVGDDRIHIVDVDDLTVIGEDDYCSECGQIGCKGDFR